MGSATLGSEKYSGAASQETLRVVGRGRAELLAPVRPQPGRVSAFAHDQQAAWRVVRELARHAAEHEAAQPGHPSRADHDQVTGPTLPTVAPAVVLKVAVPVTVLGGCPAGTGPGAGVAVDVGAVVSAGAT